MFKVKDSRSKKMIRPDSRCRFFAEARGEKARSCCFPGYLSVDKGKIGQHFQFLCLLFRRPGSIVGFKSLSAMGLLQLLHILFKQKSNELPCFIQRFKLGPFE